MIAVAMSRSENPLEGFDSCRSVLRKVYLLQVKTRSRALDDALYGICHPGAPDAGREYNHQDVVDVLNDIAKDYPVFNEIATKLAKAYREEFCQESSG